jgi:hypothetical protein
MFFGSVPRATPSGHPLGNPCHPSLRWEEYYTPHGPILPCLCTLEKYKVHGMEGYYFGCGTYLRKIIVEICSCFCHILSSPLWAKVSTKKSKNEQEWLFLVLTFKKYSIFSLQKVFSVWIWIINVNWICDVWEE